MNWMTGFYQRVAEFLSVRVGVDPLDQVCTVSEFARRVGKNERTVRRMAQRGQLPARKSGGVWLIRVEKKEIVL